jgi:pimeloyl-ACP methyl ester carboxylesterase
MSALVVYVHGLWFNGLEGWMLRQRLARRLNVPCRAFSYRSVSVEVARNAAVLGEYLARLRTDTVHLVGHSLGGIVILKLFETAPDIAPGRIVLLGSPINGSRAAAGFARWALGRRMLGVGITGEVLRGGTRRWGGGRDLGIIAGEAPFGLGRLVAPLSAPNDGAVLVDETRLEGATDHLTLRVSHSGMLFNDRVAAQTAAFLRDGRFARGTAMVHSNR